MSTAMLTIPVSQTASQADVIQAAREAAGLSPSYQSILWEAFVSRALSALEHAIAASRTPDQVPGLRWMIPVLSPAEREQLLAGPRAGMPREAFDSLLGYCVSLLDPTDGARLRSAFCSGPRDGCGWPR